MLVELEIKARFSRPIYSISDNWGPIIGGLKAAKPYEIQPNAAAAIRNEIKRKDGAAIAKRHETSKAIYLLIREGIAKSNCFYHPNSVSQQANVSIQSFFNIY